MRRIPRARAAGAALVAALVAVLGLAVSPATAAIDAVGGMALSQPTVTAGQAGPQAAGNLTPTVTGANLVSGDRLVVTLDDSDGGANCAGGASDAIGFSGAPAVTATVSAGTVPSFTTGLSGSTSCAPLSINDTFTITLTSGFNGTVNFLLTGINYTVGSGVAAGAVTVNMNGFDAGSPVATDPDPNQGDNSNATVINLVTAAQGAPSIPPGTTTATAAGNVVITELGPAAMPEGERCIRLISGNATFDTTGTNPTIAVSGGDSVSSSGRTGTTITMTVAGGATNTSTFTIGNLRVIPNVGATGPIRVQLEQTCGGAALSNSVVIASILTTQRYAGFDRYATAEVIAENTPTTNPQVITPNCNAIIARGDLFPDALAGSYLAGKLNAAAAGGIVQMGYAPILLTPPDSLSSSTLNALRNLRVKQVFILGGTAAVSQAVADQIAATATTAPVGTCGIPGTGPAGNIVVERVAGLDRYETARKVSERPGLALAGTADIDDDATAGAAENLRTAMVTTGENFPDALSGGPLAVRGTTGANGDGGGFPLILTNGTSLNSNAAAALTNLGIRQVVIVGGTAAVSDGVKTSIEGLGITVVRKAGADRSATAVAMATFARASGTAATAGEQGLNWAFAPAGGSNIINLARGDNFPDSLTGGPHSGIEFGPIVLAENPNTLGTATTNYLRSVGTTVTGTPVSTLHIFGGTAAISTATATAAQNALAGA